jgi:nitrite reductase (NADH) large subunit
MRERLLIIGGGMAATRFVEEMVACAPDRFAITVIGAEERIPYNRVLLSSLLAQDVAEDEIDLKPASWWPAQGVDLRFGERVVAIDAQGHSVTLGDGSSLSWDKLVLATGSNAVRLPLPGADLPGVLTFRDCADVEQMRAAIKPGARAAVIGGGLLGLEAAYGLAKAGVDVTVVHVMDRLMERQLDAAGASLLKQDLERRGIRVMLEAKSAAILGEGKVEALAFSDGQEIAVDMVVMAVGIAPNVQLASAAGLATKRGILVDDAMRSSVANIFALGECAEHRGIAYGLVQPAYEQARVLARVLGGGEAAFEGVVTATNLKVSGIAVFSAGDYLGEGAQVLVWRDHGLRHYRKLVLRETSQGTVLAGCVLYGETSDGLWYLDLITRAQPIDAMRNDLIFGRALCVREAA